MLSVMNYGMVESWLGRVFLVLALCVCLEWYTEACFVSYQATGSWIWVIHEASLC